ncbi:MAG: hypothetical protein HQM12_14020 [SAR324 cluster bacterium]|nr:hypothetical protein [SAR324 cluster bacterium]
MIKKIAITSMAAFLSLSVANAKCLDQQETKLCLGGEVAGALQISSSDNGTTSSSHIATPGRAELTANIVLPENNGWQTEAYYTISSDSNEKLDDYRIKVSSGNVSILAGRDGIGDITQGQNYVTEMGSTTVGTYGDGTLLNDNNLALEYRVNENLAIRGGLSYEAYEAVAAQAEVLDSTGAVVTPAQDAINADAMALALVADGNVAGLGFGFEFETKSYGEPADAPTGFTAPDGQTTLTVGLQYTIADKYTPYFNYGSFTQNADVTETGIDFGVDANLDVVGLTVGMENYDSGIDGADTTSSIYLGVIAGVFGDTQVGFQYQTSTTGDISSSETMVEFYSTF